MVPPQLGVPVTVEFSTEPAIFVHVSAGKSWIAFEQSSLAGCANDDLLRRKQAKTNSKNLQIDLPVNK